MESASEKSWRPGCAEAFIKGRHAVTLIELLVTIAVIGILAALLLSTLSSAKLKAQQARCMNNLRQMGAANSMYMDDSRGHCMPYQQSGRELWMGTLMDYQSKVDAVRFCPVAAETNTPRPYWGTADKAWNWAPERNARWWYGSYCFNGWLYVHVRHQNQNNMFTVESGIPHPSATPLFTDGIWLDCWPRTNDLPPVNLYLGDQSGMGRVVTPRHGGVVASKAPRAFDRSRTLSGAINVCGYDGHIELARLESLWTFYWNRTWEPPARRPGE